MTNVTAILSMLHEPSANSASGQCSARRLFREAPVLQWTLKRLARSRMISSLAVLCWDDQLPAVAPIAEIAGATVIAKGERTAVPEIETVAAARRWSDGWRGGLLSTCHFDLGFYAPWHHEVAQRLKSDAVVLVDPSSALVDFALIDGLIAHAEAHQSPEFCFAPAAPGLSGLYMRPALLNRMAAAKVHAGRLLHYHPDQPSRELLATENCAPVPTPVARTIHRFTLDSDRQVQRIAAATLPLNGQLISSGAEELVRRVSAIASTDFLPREIVLELNTSRSTRPIWWPGSSMSISRPDFSLDDAKRLFSQLASLDDTRLTLAGVGDPLLAPDVFTIIDAARMEAGVSIHLETDLHAVTPEQLARLAESPVDVISFHMPGLSAQSYAKVMGVDGHARVMENVRRLAAERHARGTGLPLLVPIFAKCAENFAEMESWYDQWLRALGSAVIRSPSDCGGRIPNAALADMTPPGRKPCGRIASRLTILSDGTVVSCEEDVTAVQPMGHLHAASLASIWQNQFGVLRGDHRQGQWEKHPLCGKCREWHRP
jgi:hypothetical protein